MSEDSSTMACIDQLDSPLLLLIFNNLSIQELFPVGRVCVRWNELQVTSARARQELVLLIGKDAQGYIDGSGFQIPKRDILMDENGVALFPKNDKSDVQLKIRSFPLDFACLLNAHFPILTTLTISTRLYTNEIDSITKLLKQFRKSNTTLHTLKLYSGHDPDGSNTDLNLNYFTSYVKLLSVVNDIESLRVLTFDVNTKFARNSKFPRINLPILNKLEKFEFNSADELDCFQQTILKYGVGVFNNEILNRIGLQFPIHDFAWLLSQPTELSSRFSHLHLLLNATNSSRFSNLCRNFSRLTSLEITYKLDSLTIFSLFRPLTHLQNLVSLVVNIAGTALEPLDPDERGIMHFELPSVKVFTINISGLASSHHFMHECNIIRVLPNVQVVRVIQEELICFKCRFDMSGHVTTMESLEIHEHCARYLFRHFTHSQHLRTVSYETKESKSDPRYREWAWNEMEPYEEEVEKVVGDDEWWRIDDYFDTLVDYEEDDFRDAGWNY